MERQQPLMEPPFYRAFPLVLEHPNILTYGFKASPKYLLRCVMMGALKSLETFKLLQSNAEKRFGVP